MNTIQKLKMGLLAFVLLLGTTLSQAQVKIGSNTASNKFSVLELVSQYDTGSYGGLRLPQVNNSQRAQIQIALEADAASGEAPGLTIYNTDTKCIETWNGSKWLSLCDPCKDLEDPTGFATNQSVCTGATGIMLTPPVGTAGYKWYQSDQTTLLTASTVLAAGTYYLSAVNAECETAKVPVTVTTNLIPDGPDAPTAPRVQNFCFGATGADLIPAAGISAYKWYASDGVTEILEDTPLAASTYYVTALNKMGDCESAKVAVTVTFLRVSGASTISGPISVCQGQEGIIYTATAVTNATSYYWEVPVGATITAGQGTRTVTVSFSETAESGNITVKASNNCSAGTTTVYPITLVSGSELPVAETSQSFCTAGVTAASLVPSPATSGYKWYASNGVTVLTTSTVLTSDTYYLARVTETCESPRLAVNVIASTPPTITLTSGIANQSVPMASSITAVTYTWGGGATDAILKIAGEEVPMPATVEGVIFTKNAGAKTVTITGSPLGSVTYAIVAVAASSCPDARAIGIISMDQPLTLVYRMADNDEVTLMPMSTGGTINAYVDWGDGSPLEPWTANNATHTYATAGDYTVKVSGVVSNGIFFGNTPLNPPNLVNPSADKLIEVKTGYPAGMCTTSNFRRMFTSCTNLAKIPADLFANCPNASDFTGTFTSCTSMTSIPAGLFDNNPKASDFYETFYQCRGLISPIPAGLFDNNPNVTRFMATFRDCTGLPGPIPAGLFDNNPKVTDFSSTFYRCSSLDGSIPEGLFDNNPKVTTFYSTFSQCAKLTGSIPEGLFDNNPLVKSFSSTFYMCRSMTGIPAHLFDNNPLVTDFSMTFNSMYLVDEIPAHLFDNNPLATNFSYIFNGHVFTSVPDGLFDKNLKVTNFSGVFSNCEKLESIQADIFKNQPEVTSFSNLFLKCYSLTSIPPTLFANQPKVTDFSSTFEQCTGLATIPVEIFANQPLVTTFRRAFYSCNLTSIPAGLFANNLNVTNFEQTFDGCRFTSIPTGLFDNNPLVTTFNRTFIGCSNITVIPAGLFDNNKLVTDFTDVFKGCGNLTGSAPDLWNRTVIGGYTVPTSYSGAFAYCIYLSNYSSIPTGWK